jgi:hypothetical protein
MLHGQMLRYLKEGSLSLNGVPKVGGLNGEFCKTLYYAIVLGFLQGVGLR